MRRVLVFAGPAGVAAAAATFAVDRITDLANIPVAQARTTATLTLGLIGLVVLALAARPLNRLRGLLLGAMAVGLVVVLAVPWLRAFFALALPPAPFALVALGLVAGLGVALALLTVRWRA